MRRTKKTALFLTVTLLAAMICSGCGNTESKPESEAEVSRDQIEIGMSFDSFVIERWQRERDVFIATAKDLGAEVNVQTANGEVVVFDEGETCLLKKSRSAELTFACSAGEILTGIRVEEFDEHTRRHF